jgi:hypothetical protein
MTQQGQSASSLGDPQTLAVAQLQKNTLARLNAQQQFGITVSSADGLKNLATQIKGNEAAFNQRLAQYGISKDDYVRLIVEPQVLEQKVGQHLTAGNAKVADQWDYARIQTASQKDAQSLLQQLTKGASFAALAKKQSKDTQTASKGGDVGWERLSDAANSDPMLISTFLKPLQAMQKAHAKYQIVKYSATTWYLLELLGHDPKHLLSSTQQQQDQTTAFNTWYSPIQNKAHFDPVLPTDQGGASVTSGQTTTSGQTQPSNGSGATTGSSSTSGGAQK